MLKTHWKPLLLAGISNGVLLTAILSAMVYTVKGVFKPWLVVLWFLFFFLSGVFRKWMQLKKQS